MTSNGFLLALLFIQVFILGILAALAYKHARAHFKPEKPQLSAPVFQPNFRTMPPEVKEHLLNLSQEQFQSVVKQSALHLQQQLGNSSIQINSLVQKFATDIVENEMQRYRQELDKLRMQADDHMSAVRQEMEKHKGELKAKMEQEIAAEKQRMVQQLDAKLSDAVGSFLLETLRHNVDLGSQKDYLVAMLEEHKADFIKEVGDETSATK
jgi:Tfp pilus assembly protein PilE